MTRRKISLGVFYFILISAGLFVSSFFTVIQPFCAQYPPVSPYQLIHNSNAMLAKASPGAEYGRGKAGNLFMGKHYRYLWTTQVKVPVFSFEKEQMEVVRKGGGMQTNSFTLHKKNGDAYILRSVDKDPVGTLPKFWHTTIVPAFVRDQVSATDPYAALVVADLAKVVGIYQLKPKLYFVEPGDPHFRKYGQVHGFYMLFPKRFPFQGNLMPGNSTVQVSAKNYSTQEMLQEVRRNNINSSIDTLNYLKCRLFDLLISDWDRHPGQWDWLAFSSPEGTVFRPAPKDRDQAFGYYEDGVLPWLLTRNFAVRKITSFSPEFEDIEGFVQNGSVLDKLILKKLSEKDFEKMAQFIKANVSDSVIAAATQNYPPEIYSRRAPEVQQILKLRRNKLVSGAKRFYQVLQAE